MLDDAVRVGLILVAGLVLATVVVWYVRFAWDEIRGTGEVVLDPLTIVDDSANGNDKLGAALAQMLQARLQGLLIDLRDAQTSLTATSSTAQPRDLNRLGDVRLWTEHVALSTGLLQPVEMKFSLGGVDVGGMLPWIQRRLSSRRTLHFTIYAHGNRAQIFGSLDALHLKGSGIRLEVEGTGEKQPSIDVIVDRLAHEIVRRWLAQDPSNRVELLAPAEFVTLAGILVGAADSNRRDVLGRPVQKEFIALVPRITALSDAVPDWPELGYFAAWIADKARDSATAATYYGRVVSKLDATRQAPLAAMIRERLKVLQVANAAAIDVAVASDAASAAPMLATVTTKTELDYSPDIKVVRDNGAEGSVVGCAVASALEFQIERALHETHRISERYIYYAAREVTGSTDADTGASIKDAISVVATKGAVEESVWPYVPGEFAAKPPPALSTARRFRIADAAKLTQLGEVKVALMQNGPVVAGITMYDSSMSEKTTKTGVISVPSPKATAIGGHAVVIVGYDDAKKRFKFLNSWGKTWGKDGFGYLPYEYVEKSPSEFWTFRLARP